MAERILVIEDEQRITQFIERGLIYEGYRVEVAILEGEIIQAIADFVNAHNFDVLAMATFGRKGLDRLLNGSIAEALLRRVAAPMLLIRHQSDQEMAVLAKVSTVPEALPTPA